MGIPCDGLPGHRRGLFGFEMGKDKPLSKKIRFEVFKRDKFTCQYCGKSAPEVILELEHIKPKSKGGTNRITNLLTACFDCNRGKGAKLLSDDAEITKQRTQMEQLQERRTQLEMMMEWREELDNHEDVLLDRLSDKVQCMLCIDLDAENLRKLSRILREYGYDEALTSAKISTDQYFKDTGESADKAFRYIGKICNMRKVEKEKPYLKDLFYLRGIVRNTMYCQDSKCLALLESAHLKGASITKLRNIANDSMNWTEFTETLEKIINN